MTTTEQQLIQAATSGDEKAYTTLITPCRRKAFSTCLRICGNYHDAEDALQLAVTLAWQNLDRFQGKSSFNTWFYRIVANASIDLVKRRKETYSLDATKDTEDGTLEIQLEDHTASFETQLAENDRLMQALDTLTTESREALILWTINGLKISEIAHHQGATVNTTKVRLHRAKKQLQKLLT